MKTERQNLIIALDTIVSKITILRDGSCVQRGFNCASEENGNGAESTNGHVFGRVSKTIRWDIRPDGNCHNQCWACNSRHVTDRHFYNDWYKKTFGEESFNSLMRESKQTAKWSIADMKEYLVVLRDLYRKMLENKGCSEVSQVDKVRLLDTKVKSRYR